jgi:hypothetical protein
MKLYRGLGRCVSRWVVTRLYMYCYRQAGWRPYWQHYSQCGRHIHRQGYKQNRRLIFGYYYGQKKYGTQFYNKNYRQPAYLQGKASLYAALQVDREAS